MTQVDIGRVALGAPALQQVFVVSRPECLLVKSWARNERSNTEDAAALIGKLFRDCDDALKATSGSAEPRTLMVESNDRVLVVARVAEDMAAAFVFEQSAPLGLIRVQARQLTAQLARTLAAENSRPPAHTSATSPRATAPAPRPPAATPQPRTTNATPRPPAVGPAPVKRSPAPATAVAGSRQATVTRDLNRTRPERTGSQDLSPAFGVTPAPSLQERSPAFGVPPAQPTPAKDPTGGRFEQLTVRIAAFTQASHDARSALLRLSLRTGLPMELLERPGALSPAQAEHVSRALDELQKKPG